MALSLHINTICLFHPIGNTTPVCLTRDLPPDVPANILLLPCGDPRNLLYTVFCEESSRLRRSLDFTCSDYDPGVLARDVLLLTMIMDGIAAQTMWNIFFHTYLDADSRSTLVSQSQKLASYTSVQAWRWSPYGSVIRMGTDHTLAELRRHWELYSDFYNQSTLHQSKALQEVMGRTTREEAAAAFEDSSSAPIRSTGLLSLHSQAGDLFDKLHRRYWETGTTITDKTTKTASTHPNPTFLYSRAGEGFNVSPFTNPIVPFAHDTLFGNAGDRTLTVEDLVDSTRSQFRAWCSAFQAVTTKEKTPDTLIVIRFLLGDALAVARALQGFSENPVGGRLGHPLTTLRVTPWTTCPMELNREEYADLGAPIRFDAIDTSNVSDTLGLLNLFLATAPLLTGSSSSVLYTEFLKLLSSDPSTEFEATMFASLSVVAVLMDLVPVDVLSGFTSTCNIHELVITYLRSKHEGTYQHQQRLTWKRPSSGDPLAYADGGPRILVSFDTHQLAKLLHHIYLDMFRSEDPDRYAPGTSKTDEGRNDKPSGALLHGLIVCPSREGFIAFLGFIRASLAISEEQWPEVMRSFLEMRLENQPQFDKFGDNDMHAQLYRYGLHTVPELDDVSHPSTISESEPGRLSFWPSIPPLIRVFLTVPRDEFAKLENDIAGTKVPFNVWMHCAIDFQAGPDTDPDRYPHVFQSVDAAYGTLVDTGTAAAPNLTFQEDRDGEKNGADLVVSFVVPSRVLQYTEPPAATIKLKVRPDPHTVPRLLSALGMELCIFSANMEDTDYVHLLPEPQLPLPSHRWPSCPDPARARLDEARLDEVGAIGFQPPVRVDMDSTGKQIATLTARLQIMNAAALADVASGVMPSSSQCSPCTVQVVLGSRSQTLAYPVPVVGSQRKLRFARKSSYIEVVVPVAIPFLEPDGFKVNPFPVVRANGSLLPWNFHRVSLDQLPVLDRANISDDQLNSWLGPHLSFPRSLRERTVFEDDPAHTDPLVNLKMTITGTMMIVSGLGGPSGRVFALQPKARGRHADPRDAGIGIDTPILFADKFRYDDAGHIMVLDAFILVFSQEVRPHVQAALPYLVAQGLEHLPVLPGEKETHAWRKLLPALVERCRTTWAHRADCEYRVVQPDGSVRWQVPRELPKSKVSSAGADSGQGDPLCSCGRGKDVEGMMGDAVWRLFAPYATRIALSPLFGVSHVEQILDQNDMFGTGQEIDWDLERDTEPVTHAPGPAPARAPVPVGVMEPKADTVTVSSSDSGGPQGAADLKSVATCDRCKKEEVGGVKLLQCARCKMARYCSGACQKSDWKTHKLRCRN